MKVILIMVAVAGVLGIGLVQAQQPNRLYSPNTASQAPNRLGFADTRPLYTNEGHENTITSCAHQTYFGSRLGCVTKPADVFYPLPQEGDGDFIDSKR